MKDFIQLIKENYNNIFGLTIFNLLKTGNPLYDAIISTFSISFFGYIINYISNYGLNNIISIFSFDNLLNLFFKKNTIIIEGKRCSTTSRYSSTYTVSSLYSDRFKAILNYIINNIENNKTIYSIKEAHTNYQYHDKLNDKMLKKLDMFMVFQNNHFQIDNDIFMISEIDHEYSKDDTKKNNTKIDKITITIYSYIYSLDYLKNYIDTITEKYLLSIKNERKNKKFIYLLEKTKISDEESELSCWREDEYESARTFNNIFFDGKKEILEKITFFLNNRKWYYDKGIPYTLGIGLHGPPGTGKTSFIKALANYTGRHLVVLSLKIIKTKDQLGRFFFENTYNSDNEKNTITFDKKIIVIEDIDCIGDIILDRNTQNKTESGKNENNEKNENNKNNANLTVGNVLKTMYEINEKDNNKIINSLQQNPITLDDILNLWDGIRETPGRILVISSNHYNKLDPALVRPGRIDITHELNNASHQTISEIYLHLFEKKIDENKLTKVKEYFYSPAELVNMFVTYKNENDFMKRLLLNQKL